MKNLHKDFEQRIYEKAFEQFPSDGYERQGKRGRFTKILTTSRWLDDIEKLNYDIY